VRQTPLEVVSSLADALGSLSDWDEVLDELRQHEAVGLDTEVLDELARHLCLLDAAARRAIRQLEHRVVLR
jgi:hypothetical protein